MKLAEVTLAMILARVVLPTPGGPQKMRLALSSFFYLQAQRLASGKKMRLAEELVERAGAHALSERGSLAAGRVRGSVAEETHSGSGTVASRFWPGRLVHERGARDGGVQRLDRAGDVDER